MSNENLGCFSEKLTSTNLPGYTDGCESVSSTCEEHSPTDQQDPDIVLTFILQENNLMSLKRETFVVKIMYVAGFCYYLRFPLALT